MRQTERIVQNIIKIIDLRKKTWKILQKVVSLPKESIKRTDYEIESFKRKNFHEAV